VVEEMAEAGMDDAVGMKSMVLSKYAVELAVPQVL
jgi:hypothetical protein